MKKILFVHYALVCGGIETALLDLCSLLNKEKYEVTVLEYAVFAKNVLKPQFIEAGIRVISPYHALKPGKNIFQKVCNVIRQGHIEYRLNQKREIVINEHFDLIVYFQNTPIRVKCPSSPKVITYVHGDISTNALYREDILKQRNKISTSDKIVCVSNLAKESLAKVTGITDNTVAIFNPINSGKILSMSEMAVPERFSRPYICAVGRLSPEKRFDGLVRIHKHLLDRGLDHDLVIVGEGDERAKIEAIIQETGTANSVHLPGFKENPYPYMKHSLFMVCSSLTEGLPVISMESLLLGRPIVSSFPSVGELFGDKECGIITDIDLDSLEEGIYKMLADQEFYQTCVENAIERSVWFDSPNMVAQVEAMLNEVLA